MEKKNAKCSQLKNLCSLLSLLVLNHSHSLEGENTFTLNRTKKTIKCQYFKNTLQNFLLNFKSNHLLDSLSVYLFKLFLLFVNCKKFLLIVSIQCSIWPLCLFFGQGVSICMRPFCFDRYSKLKRPKL